MEIPKYIVFIRDPELLKVTQERLGAAYFVLLTYSMDKNIEFVTVPPII